MLSEVLSKSTLSFPLLSASCPAAVVAASPIHNSSAQPKGFMWCSCLDKGLRKSTATDAGRGVPKPHGAVHTGRRQTMPIVAERDIVDALGVPFQRDDLLPGDRVP